MDSKPAVPPIAPSYIPVIRNNTQEPLARKSDAADSSKPAASQRPEPNEFQQFIERSTGLRLPLYGADLFQNVPSTFAPVEKIAVPSDYVIGPGDAMLIRGWGQVEIDYRAEVDREGKIYLPQVGEISVSGIKYGQLSSYLKSSIGRVFKNFDLSVTMTELRSIQIFMVGAAKRPGSYTISSLSTLVNAIFASGGPAPNGSMRDIQLKRGNRVIRDFDLYDLLLRGDKSQDSNLLPGDVIYIPPAGAMAAITGSVGSPAVYELRGATTMSDLVQLAGGLTPIASVSHATVEHIAERTVRTISELDLDAAGLKSPIKNGDLVTVLPLSARFDNAVTLRGHVTFPGRYPWKEGMRISDLIPDQTALVPRSYWQRKDEIGNNSDLLLLPSDIKRDQEKTDRLSQSEVQEPKASADTARQRDVSADKADSAGRQNVVENELRGDVKRFTPDINWDYALIQRFDREELKSRLLKFDLGKVVFNHDQAENVALQPGDVVTIFSQLDVKVPAQKQTKFVRLEGEFNASGVYEVLPGETLQQLVTRIGGITPQAYLYGAELTRQSAREQQQERFDEFVSRLELDVERNASIKSQTSISPEDTAAAKIAADSQRRLVEKLKETRAKGRIVLGISPLSAGVTSIPQIPLEDGDEFLLPFAPSVVNVIGAVYNENAFIFEPGRSVSYYLRKAGGGTKDADLSRVFVVRADGSVVSKQSGSGWFSQGIASMKLYPGDTVVVSEKLDKYGLLRGLRDWSSIIGQFGIGIAAVHTLFP